MKKYFLLCLLFVLGIFSLFLSPKVFAQSIDQSKLIAANILPQEGSWIVDPEVTKIGKNASRSGQLLDWTLRDYQWSSSSSQESDTNPLAGFWVVIQRIVYALFLVVILITSFILIVTRGKSLSAKRFLPRFLLAVILVTFSFSLIQFIYQFIDILQGFFLNNSHGEIISSKDLLYIGFNYTDFEGLRRFGASFDESAFMSLILVKFTAFTYYVMALLLIFRKILLWFFIVLSPLFPILLLFYPVRNTGKVWIGEFFRWVLYAPLFAIFLSGLVRLWESPSGLPLLFDFAGVQKGDTIYPTAVNILLGGPGQKIGLTNSVNLPDTFALYIVALIMLWAVIILPFILLQIFLDHMMSYNYQNNPLSKQITSLMATRLTPPPKPLEPPPSPLRQPGGLARNIPYGRKFEVPTSAGLAREIPRTVNQQVPAQISTTRNIATSSTVSNLTQLSIPTMRDIARYEMQKRSQDASRSSEVERTKKTLLQIANPTNLTIASDRERYQAIREKLRVASQSGDRFAANILQAANTYTYFASQQSASTTINQGIRNLATPERIISVAEKEKVEKIKEKIIKESREGNIIAKQVASGLDQLIAEQTSILKKILLELTPAGKDKISSGQYQLLREHLTAASNSGNAVATNVISAIEKSTSEQDVQNLFNTLIRAEKEGSPVAHEVLHEVEKQVSQTSSDRVEQIIKDANDKKDSLGMMVYDMLHEQQKEQKAPISASAKLKSGTLPAVNRIQEVSVDDYEAVKKMWKENYKNLKTDERTINRRDEIRNDIGHIQETISLLSSSNSEMVEQGMKQVSDILPFLLIGGFSQTEILTYLKAKLEAAKSTIEEMSEKDDEEDTFVAAERAAKHVVQKMTMKTQAPLPTEHIQESENSLSEVINSQTASSSARNITSIFNQINLPVITLRDIVRFDQAADSVRKEPLVDAIRQNLLNIDNPQRGTSVQDREKYTALHNLLDAEDKKGNPLAKAVLGSIEELKQQSGVMQLSADQAIAVLYEQMMRPYGGSIDTAVTQLVDQHSAQDPLVQELKVSFEKWLMDIKENTKEFLEKVSDPTRLPTAVEQMRYNKLLERVSLAGSNGNETASYIIKSIREKSDEEHVLKIYQKIADGARNGDELSLYLLNFIYPTSPQVKNTSEALFEKLLAKQKVGDSFATSLLREIVKSARKSDGKKASSIPLPKANRIQTVTLDDYETVKKLWMENYRSVEPPQDAGKKLSRADWISQDSTSIADAINLLSSGNPDNVQAGMEKVGDILPFLLLGGFSKDEIIGYLKAKLEAGKVVLEEVHMQTQESETLIDSRKTSVTPKKAHMTTELEDGSNVVGNIQSAFMPTSQPVLSRSDIQTPMISQLKLPLPTLKDIATFEQQHNEISVPTIMKLRKFFANLADPLSVTSQKEQDEIRSLRQMLNRNVEKGDIDAGIILNAMQVAQASSTNSPLHIMMTLNSLFDPSVIQDVVERKEYLKAREEFIHAREVGSESALNLVKIVDVASQELTNSTMKLVQLLAPGAQKIDSARFEELRTKLESTKESKIAQLLLASSVSTITQASANKVKEQLFEAAFAGDNFAREVVTNYLTLPQSTVAQITNFYQQLQASRGKDPLAEQLLRLLAKQKRTNFSQLGSVRLPKQNRMQKVSFDDYEAVRQLLYDMYLHSDVPASADGKVQTREQWITLDKDQTTKVINLISSDVQENVSEGLGMVGDILPFLLIGGFAKDEITQYLKAKETAAEMALQTLRGSEGAVMELVPAKAVKEPLKKSEETLPDGKGGN